MPSPGARPAPPRQGDALQAASDFVQSVLFTDNESIIRQEAEHVYSHDDLEDGLAIFDNGHKLGGGANGPRPEEIIRPQTSAVGAAPPTARGGARPTGDNRHSVIAAAQSRSNNALRRPLGFQAGRLQHGSSTGGSG